MSIRVSKDEVRVFEKLKAISQIAPIKERIRFFEGKYGCTLGEFETIIKREKEDFESWDDYIEWKAYAESLKDLESKMGDIAHAQDVRIT
ncbi:hypothetical protein C5S30_01700 [ANME-1 cluster archaeon GoMg4]|nr:hypothetical protein [ANME-1 cluster archaeon GoMg4]